MSYQISTMSQKFNLLFKCLFIGYPIFIVAVWLFGISLPVGYFSISRLPVETELNTVRLSLRVLACLIYMIPTFMVMMIFYRLSQLFALYAKNVIFSEQNIICIRKIGFLLLWQGLANTLVQPFLTAILTWDAPKGQHIMAMGISADDVTYLMIGSVVVLIALIMEEGQKLEEEKSFTV